MRARPLLLSVSLAVAAVTMPGCIVEDIRDQMVLINEQMTQIDAHLVAVDRRLEKLDTIDTSLESIDTSLTTVDQELDGIAVTLTALDKHLASLRRTLSNIDSTIPFLKLSDDEEVEDTPEADGEGANTETEAGEVSGEADPASDGD